MKVQKNPKTGDLIDAANKMHVIATPVAMSFNTSFRTA
jgi:hypothetical protein